MVPIYDNPNTNVELIINPTALVKEYTDLVKGLDFGALAERFPKLVQLISLESLQESMGEPTISTSSHSDEVTWENGEIQRRLIVLKGEASDVLLTRSSNPEFYVNMHHSGGIATFVNVELPNLDEVSAFYGDNPDVAKIVDYCVNNSLQEAQLVITYIYRAGRPWIGLLSF